MDTELWQNRDIYLIILGIIKRTIVKYDQKNIDSYYLRFEQWVGENCKKDWDSYQLNSNYKWGIPTLLKFAKKYVNIKKTNRISELFERNDELYVDNVIIDTNK